MHDKVILLLSVLTEEEMRAELRQRVTLYETKSFALIGRELGLKNGWAAIAKTRKDKGISKKVLDYFGYEKITMYRKKEKETISCKINLII